MIGYRNNKVDKMCLLMARTPNFDTSAEIALQHSENKDKKIPRV